MGIDKIRVLLVDDNGEICDILKNFFDLTEDIEICGIANNGEDAISKIRDYRPDVVLLDIIMPKLDGVSVLQRLNENPPPKKPCILVLSAIGQEKVTTTALSLGAAYYMIKPFNLEDLLERIYLLAGNKNRFPQTLSVSDDQTLTGVITKHVIRLGVPTNIIGYRYIIEAVRMMIQEAGALPITKQVYTTIAENNNTSVECVESSIRKTVDRVFRLNNEAFRELMRLSTPPIEKKPTNSRFLTILSEKSSWRTTSTTFFDFLFCEPSEALMYSTKADNSSVAEPANRAGSPGFSQDARKFGSFLIEPTTRELWWSDEVYQIFGIKQGARVSIGTFFDMIHSKDRLWLRRALPGYRL
jgi:two-component system response regulator (stage 0 sporulation protein A)